MGNFEDCCSKTNHFQNEDTPKGNRRSRSNDTHFADKYQSAEKQIPVSNMEFKDKMALGIND